jgi:hypothetical protein
MRFDFSFGKKKKTIVQWAVISVVLTSIVTGIHRCTGISEKNIWNLFDELGREANKRNIPGASDLNDYVTNTPELLKQRVHRDVDYAILDYERWEREHYIPRMKNQEILKEIRKPEYTETQRRVVEDAVYYECKPDGSRVQELLGGAQGIHAAWYNSEECNY